MIHTSNLYVNNNSVSMRIVSVKLEQSNSIDAQLFHLTDTQYITQKGISTSTYLSQEAKDAYQSMTDYMIDQSNQHNLVYTMMTGDFVQSVSKGTEEWPFVTNHLFKPLWDNQIPFGVSSGNHDIGALREVSIDGSNALDDELFYDYYSQYLGEEAFHDYSTYIGNYENNRSHYDVISIQGHEFLFLYLGWGSSIFGVHVSTQDINYAKNVLSSNPDKTVVLLTHDYMSNNGNRTITGEYLYQTLVKPYNNISFVFSGHVNGTSSRVDLLDSNQDGIKDRSVLQVLTDLQEEEELFGATYIRRIGLDFTNNQMIFDIYSPYFGDSDVFVNNNPETVKQNRDFVYDFALNKDQYGLKTNYLG